jgi:hypothetical protein
MKPKEICLMMLTLLTFGCSPIPSKALVALSEREGQFYSELRPALGEARNTFQVTADALVTNRVERQAAIMRREAAPRRLAIYEALASPNPTAKSVGKAIGDLALANAAVQAMLDKESEAAQLRMRTIDEAFATSNTALDKIMENQRALHGYLRARRHIFGGPGRSAFFQYSTFAELMVSLEQAIDTLDEQFKLAKELVDTAKEEFGNIASPSKP